MRILVIGFRSSANNGTSCAWRSVPNGSLRITAAPAHVRYNALLAGVDLCGSLRTQAGNVGDLARSVAQGWAGATSLDDQRLRAWQVVFEENIDGRRRARIDSVQLQPSDSVAIAPWHVYLDDTGDTVQSSISY